MNDYISAFEIFQRFSALNLVVIGGDENVEDICVDF